MSTHWEISGQDGHALGAARVSLEAAGITSVTLQYESLETDSLSWSQVDGIIPEEGQQVALFGDGKCFLRGHVQVHEGEWKPGGMVYNIVVVGPMWWMANTPITSEETDGAGSTAERASIQFPLEDRKISIRKLIDRATAVGLPIRCGVIDPMFEVGSAVFSGNTFLSVLLELLKPMPDACSWIDYEAPGLPTLNITRRLHQMERLTLVAGVDDLTGAKLRPRSDVRVEGVKVLSAKRGADGKAIFSEDSIGTAKRPQIVTLSGPEVGGFSVPTNIPKMEIETAAVSGSWAEAVLLDSAIKSAQGTTSLVDFSPFPGAGPYWVWTGSSSSGGSGISMTAIPFQSTDASTGEAVALAGWYRMSTGQMIDFLKTDYGLIERSIKIICQFYTAGMGTIDDVCSAQPVVAALRDANRLKWNTGYNSNNTGASLKTDILIRAEYTVPSISLAFSPKQTVYPKAAWEFLQPPYGLPNNLFEAQNWLPWEGTLALGPKQAFRRMTATRLNILGADPAWETAGALVQGQTLMIPGGMVGLRVGAASRVGMSAVVGKFRSSSPSDNVYAL